MKAVLLIVLLLGIVTSYEESNLDQVYQSSINLRGGHAGHSASSGGSGAGHEGGEGGEGEGVTAHTSTPHVPLTPEQ